MRYWGGKCRQTCPIEGKYAYTASGACCHLPSFAHIAPSQLHTDLGHCAKGHDGVYLVFFMLTCTRRTHGQIFVQHSLVAFLKFQREIIASGRWSGVARLGVCPWRRRAKKPRILAGSTDCLGHSWDLRDSDQWPPVPIAIEVKHVWKYDKTFKISERSWDLSQDSSFLTKEGRPLSNPKRFEKLLKVWSLHSLDICWFLVVLCRPLKQLYTIHHIASGFLVSSSMHLEC